MQIKLHRILGGLACAGLLAGALIAAPATDVLAKGEKGKEDQLKPGEVEGELETEYDVPDVDAGDKPYQVFDASKGIVDKGTYDGYIRYNSICYTCHGPDGLGTTFAPALIDSLKAVPYEDFVTIVINGRSNVGGGKSSVMPAFGDDPNVVKYIDDIYAYLKARSDDVLGRGRPHFVGQKIMNDDGSFNVVTEEGIKPLEE